MLSLEEMTLLELKELAKETGVHIATIYRELERGNAGEGYNANLAQQTL